MSISVGAIQSTLNAFLAPYADKSSRFFSTPASTHLARRLDISNNGERKLAIYYIHDMCKISRDKWIVVANWLQTTYGGGLAESTLNSHCG